MLITCLYVEIDFLLFDLWSCRYQNFFFTNHSSMTSSKRNWFLLTQWFDHRYRDSGRFHRPVLMIRLLWELSYLAAVIPLQEFQAWLLPSCATLSSKFEGMWRSSLTLEPVHLIQIPTCRTVKPLRLLPVEPPVPVVALMS